MLQENDFISIPYTPDLSQAGIRRACQRYVLEAPPEAEDPLEGLIQTEYQTALELAFQHYLQENHVPYERRASAPLSAPGDTDLILGGRRVVLRNFPISGKNQIRRLLHEPDFYLNSWARLPQAHSEVDPLHADDVYVFAFIAALIAQQGREFKRAMRAQQPAYLVHLLPDAWARRDNGRALGSLALKADCEQEISLELGGQGAGGQSYTEWVHLLPRQRVSTHSEFLSLAYLHAEGLPEAGWQCTARHWISFTSPDRKAGSIYGCMACASC